MQFDHLNLDDESRALIEAACARAPIVYLAPLDKGLSGSAVWLAKWRRASGAESKFHVFKIGNSAKLKREMDAIRDIASVIEPGFPNVELLGDKNPSGMALLRQEFMGDSDGQVTSLRLYLQKCDSGVVAEEMIRRLYQERLKRWHPPAGKVTYELAEGTVGEALDSWWKRAAIAEQVDTVGKPAISASFAKRFGITVDAVVDSVDHAAGMKAEFSVGPVHGDLHSQNVLVGSDDALQVIDYGWTSERWRAVDFFMMECSLKFLVAPANAQLDDLIRLENTIEPALTAAPVELSDLSGCMLSSSLTVIACAIQGVRRSALETGAVSDPQSYRAGLAVMTAAHTTHPGLNQLYLLHSLAFHAAR